jgi:hypothetical protein
MVKSEKSCTDQRPVQRRRLRLREKEVERAREASLISYRSLGSASNATLSAGLGVAE